MSAPPAHVPVVRVAVTLPDGGASRPFRRILQHAIEIATTEGLLVELADEDVGAKIRGQLTQARSAERDIASTATTLASHAAVVFTNSQNGLGLAYRVHEERVATVSGELLAIASVLARFFAAVGRDDGIRPDATRMLLEASESLITRLDRLLDEKQELLDALAKAYRDIDTARARVALLESQLAALQYERNGTSQKWRSPSVLASIALTIATILAPVASGLIDHRLSEAVGKVAEDADRVQAACNVTVTVRETGQFPRTH